MVGQHGIKVTQCTKIKTLQSSKGEMLCEWRSGEKKEMKLKTLPPAHEVQVELWATEYSAIRTRLLIVIKHTAVRHIKMSSPMYVRYWTITKTKHKDFIPSGRFIMAPLIFRVLSSRCQPAERNFHEKECMTNMGKYLGHVNWATNGRPCLPWYIYTHHPLKEYRIPNTTKVPQYENHCRAVFSLVIRYERTGLISWKTIKEMKRSKKTLCFTDLHNHHKNCEVPYCNVVEGFVKSVEKGIEQSKKDYCNTRAKSRLQRKIPRYNKVMLPQILESLCKDEVYLVNVLASPSPSNPEQYVFVGK